MNARVARSNSETSIRVSIMDTLPNQNKNCLFNPRTRTVLTSRKQINQIRLCQYNTASTMEGVADAQIQGRQCITQAAFHQIVFQNGRRGLGSGSALAQPPAIGNLTTAL